MTSTEMIEYKRTRQDMDGADRKMQNGSVGQKQKTRREGRMVDKGSI